MNGITNVIQSVLSSGSYFVCSARLTDIDPSHGSRWLALATSKLIDSYVAFPIPCLPIIEHEDFFMDAPRISTLQALLIILKLESIDPHKAIITARG